LQLIFPERVGFGCNRFQAGRGRVFGQGTRYIAIGTGTPREEVEAALAGINRLATSAIGRMDSWPFFIPSLAKEPFSGEIEARSSAESETGSTTSAG
jgi:hypothetical protein